MELCELRRFHFSHVSDVTDRANYANVCHVNHKNFARTHALEHDYAELKYGSARRRFYVALHETVGRTEFHQAKTMKTHSNNLVVLTHDQLREKMYRALSRFSVLQAMESWGGGGWERGYVIGAHNVTV